MGWLIEENPLVDWQAGTWRYRPVMMLVGTPPTEFPYHTRNYEDVFSETEAAVLPENGGTYEIKLVEGAAPAYGPLYNLSVKELDVVRKYLCSNEDEYLDSLLCWSSGLVRVEIVFTAMREA